MLPDQAPHDTPPQPEARRAQAAAPARTHLTRTLAPSHPRTDRTGMDRTDEHTIGSVPLHDDKY